MKSNKQRRRLQCHEHMESKWKLQAWNGYHFLGSHIPADVANFQHRHQEEKNRTLGSRTKAKHIFFSWSFRQNWIHLHLGAHEGNPINSKVFFIAPGPSRVSAWSHFFCVISTPRHHLGGVGEDLVYPSGVKTVTPRWRPRSSLVYTQPWCCCMRCIFSYWEKITTLRTCKPTVRFY